MISAIEKTLPIIKKSQKGSDFELRVLALTNILVEKGLVTHKDIEARYEIVRARTPMSGAKIIARAWVDPEFKAKLKKDAKAAITEMGPNLLDANNGEPVDTCLWSRARPVDLPSFLLYPSAGWGSLGSECRHCYRKFWFPRHL